MVFQKDSEADRYHEIFFAMCSEYRVSWLTASEKEKYFIEETTRVTYECDKTKCQGLPLSDIRPTVAS